MRIHSRWWNVRKCAAWSWLHARIEFIVPRWRKDCARPAVGNCHSRQPARRPFAVVERIIPIGCDFLLSSKSRDETSIILVSPTLRNFHLSLETRNFAKALIYRATVHKHQGIFHVAPSHVKCLYLRHRHASHGMDTLLVIDHDIMKASTPHRLDHAARSSLLKVSFVSRAFRS